MSTKICRFGVPPDTTDAAILGACARVFEHGEPSTGFVGIQEPERVRQRKWFYLLVAGWDWELEEVAEDLSRDFPELTALIWMDNVGAFKLEHYRGGADTQLVLGLVSEGPRVDVYAGTITGDYPQLRFSPRELRAMERKPEEELTDLEREVVQDYQNAVSIGLAELFPEDGRAFLSVGYEREVYALVVDGEPVAPRRVRDDQIGYGVDNLPYDWMGMPVEDYGDTGAAVSEGRAAYEQARRLDAAGAWQEALEASQRGLESHPSFHDNWLHTMERAYAGLNRLPEALATIDRLLRSPSLSDDMRGLCFYNRACYLSRQGELDAAMDALDAAIAIDPVHGADAPDDPDFAPLYDSPRFRASCGR